MLLGRDEERAALNGLIDVVGDGLSGALVLHGEAGMGKSALLEYAMETASNLQLSRIVGIEAECHVSFAALHRLLQPSLGRLSSLPQPQRDGLSAALGLTGHAAADPFLIGLATLTLLADRATERGLLCIVDDCQWIDAESLQAIAFAARRLQAEKIAIVFGMRTPTKVSGSLADFPGIEITGLPDAAAHDLLSTVVTGPLDARVAQHIITETSGCPLALRELANELSADQWIGADRVSTPIPISRQLEAHFRRQLEELSPETQTFVLVAAAEASGDVSLVRRAARDLGCDEDCELAAVRDRLLSTEPFLQFRHPLIRSAVYTGASAADRRRVHRALADSTDRSIDPDRWAQHLAAITTGYDGQLADDLESGANRARDRGGYAAEASLLTQAAGFTEHPELRSKRLLEASAAALSAGELQRARKLLSQARLELRDPLLLAQAQQLDGRLRVSTVQPSMAPALFLAAAQQFLPLDGDRARHSMLDAFESFLKCQYFTDGTDGAEIAKAALAARRSDSFSSLADLLLDGVSRLCGTGYAESVGSLRRAAQLLQDGPISAEDMIRWISYGMVITDELWDDRTYIAWVERVESVARKRGALIALQVSLIGLAVHQIRIGRFSAAEAYYSESLELTTATDGAGSLALDLYRPLNVDLLAWRGDDAGTRFAVARLIEMGEAVGMAVVQFQAYHALAILELGAGRYAEALVAAEFATDRQAIGWKCQSLPLVVEAGIRSGNLGVAERALDELTMRATASATPWALGLLARSQALMADDSLAEELFKESIAHLKQTLVVTDLAMAHLSYGEWLRRHQRRIDARTQLREAYEAFQSMGAAGFAERARSELLATGEHAVRRTVETTNDLTPQELKIAQLASRGATNPEIAAQMFISPSTVDYHLRKIYRKLGITSRRQLERALPL
jgi:DNA-binding CsgD family transcriptional regulator